MRLGRRGFALAMTLVIIALVAIVTFTAINVSQLDSRASQADYTSTRALYAARAGLNWACTNIQNNYAWTGASSLTVGGVAGQESFNITVQNATWNGSVTNNSANRWRITSVGSFGGAQRTLIGFAQVEPFSKYAYFTDQERSSAGTPIRFSGSDILTGAVHTNGFFTFSGLTNFTDTVTSHNNKVSANGPTDDAYNTGSKNYPTAGTETIGSSTYAWSATNNSAQFYHYDQALNLNTAGPRAHVNSTVSPYFSFQGGSAPVPLPGSSPTVTDPLATISGNANSALTNDTGHAYNATATYRVNYNDGGTNTVTSSNGSVGTFEKSTNGGSSWSTVSEDQTPPVYKVVFTQSPPRATVYRKDIGGAGNVFVQQGSPIPTDTQPGVTLFMKGITLVSGTVSGRVTLGSQYDMHIVGNLVHGDPSRDVLGIVSGGNILVEQADGDGRDRNIDAIMMTPRGSFQVDRYGNKRGSGASPYLHINGGLIQDTRGTVATGSAGGATLSGFSKDYKYDNKLRSTPPLNFPTTGKIVLTAIRDMSALGSQ